MHIRLLLILITLAVAAAPAEAGFYTWTDGDGRQFYTNELEKVPPQYRSTANTVEMRDDRVSTGQGMGAPNVPRTVKVAPHKDRNGRGEAYWKKRADDLRRKLRKQQDRRASVAKQKASTRKAQRARERKLARIDEDITGLKHELEVELPDEARRADALPGWLR